MPPKLANPPPKLKKKPTPKLPLKILPSTIRNIATSMASIQFPLHKIVKVTTLARPNFAPGRKKEGSMPSNMCNTIPSETKIPRRAVLAAFMFVFTKILYNMPLVMSVKGFKNEDNFL